MTQHDIQGYVHVCLKYMETITYKYVCTCHTHSLLADSIADFPNVSPPTNQTWPQSEQIYNIYKETHIKRQEDKIDRQTDRQEDR